MWIMDAGFVLQSKCMSTGIITVIGQYGVWGRCGNVIETGNDLEFLLKKYNLTEDDVHHLLDCLRGEIH